MNLRISKIHDAAPYRPPGYVEDVLSRGVVDGEWLELPDEEYAALIQKYSPKPKLPSTAIMARNAATALRDEIKARIIGLPEIEAEEVARRLEICRWCEHFIPEQGRCSQCGCFMNFKTKLRSQHCPINKW